MQATMLRRPSAAVNPIAIYAFVDVVMVKLDRAGSVSRTQFETIRAHCGGGAQRLTRRYRHYRHHILALYQPDEVALACLAQLPVSLTLVELSLDWIFARYSQCENALIYLDRHLVKSHLRAPIGFSKTTRYAGKRKSPKSPNVIAIYGDRASKITGEYPCLHIDWRLGDRSSLQRAGLATVRDVLDLDHRQFWQSRLRLYRVDTHKLGRLLYRHIHGNRRRTWIKSYLDGKFRIDVFRRTGAAMMHRHKTVQELIRVYRHLRVRDCLVRLDSSHLLPPPPAFVTPTYSVELPIISG